MHVTIVLLVPLYEFFLNLVWVGSFREKEVTPCQTSEMPPLTPLSKLFYPLLKGLGWWNSKPRR